MDGTEHPDLPWCRYADDGLVHCRTEAEAVAIKAALAARLAECQLEMHPDKTKIVYCKDGKRRGNYPKTKFDFLGYCFRPRGAINRKAENVYGIWASGQCVIPKAMRQKIRELNLRRRTHVRLADIARSYQPDPTGVVELLWALLPLRQCIQCGSMSMLH